MWRILFFILWIALGGVHKAQAIEIFVNGRKFDSFEAYQASKKVIVPSAASATLDSDQENYVRQEAQLLGMKVDFSKIKTLQINRKLPYDTLHKLYVLGVEKAMAGALEDFYQGSAQRAFSLPQIVSSQQLQGAIQQAVASSSNPKLLISAPGKLRIMSLTASDQPEAEK